MSPLLFLCLIAKLTASYDIKWSDAFTYYDGGSRSPYTINLRGQTNSSLIICFEELVDTKYTGLCEAAELDLDKDEISFGLKTIFQLENATDPYEIQIYGPDGWTNEFLLAYTNGPNSAEGPGKIMMGKYLGDGRLTYSWNEVTFNPYLNDNTNVIELQNNSYFIICASVGPRSQYDTACRIGKYDLDSGAIQLGSKVFNMTTDHPVRGMAVARINSYTFVACMALFVDRRGVCFVGEVQGNFADGLETDIHFGSEIVMEEDLGVDEVKIIHANQTELVMCYTTFSVGRCRMAHVVPIGNNDRYTIEFEAGKFDFNTDGIDSPAVFRVPPNSLTPNQNNPELLGICYVDENNGVCKFGVIDFDNNAIVFDEDETEAFGDRGVGKINAIYLSETTNKLVVCYIKFAGATPLFNRGLCKYGTVTTDS